MKRFPVNVSLLVAFLLLAGPLLTQAQDAASAADQFSRPLGFSDDHQYLIHYVADKNGNLYANPNLNYPGLVVIIEHTLASGRKLYSVYAHLDDTSLAVRQDQQVLRGQRLGTVMYQRYAGRFPERHPDGDDSHLHFELRYFFSGRAIYQAYPACNDLIAGRGYIYPDRPENFPASGSGYVNPDAFIQTR